MASFNSEGMQYEVSARVMVLGREGCWNCINFVDNNCSTLVKGN